ncbi:DUF3179 domain-containing protein [Candidatus Nitrosotenuis uzonensis]|uniref:DUF3179 domain-containing protein n=1 Tax=Candidatus Nitrosotenuis uzonensis TaxID=1407055 RepID=A0A812F3Q1_9ARCH|nr:conserved hypothetical protein [Candidatus Nitrosotenuis uzonensis]
MLNLKYTVAVVGGGAIVTWVVLALYMGGPFAENTLATPMVQITPSQTPTQISAESKVEIQTTNGIKHIVPLEEIRSGGPPKDGIPSIDNPKFVSASEAEFVSDDDIVMGLELNGETKAYPLFILVWHEIVNDKFGDTSVAVTYCPLCFTMQVFDRTVNGAETEFGTSGKLYNSNLVMYDRNTDSQWSQAMGQSITGELAGQKLARIPFDVAKWSDWKNLHPDTLVLTTETGHLRPYGSDPYGDYYTDPRIIFPVKHQDDRMHPKEIILGFDHADSYKAYKLTDVEDKGIVNDEFGGQKILLVSVSPFTIRAFDRVVDGETLEFAKTGDMITDKQTSSEWNVDGVAVSGPMEGKQLVRLVYDPGFWFEWVAFHPDTEVY